MATVKVYRYDADTGKAISTFVRVGKFGTDKADKEDTDTVSEFPLPYLTKPNGNLYAIEKIPFSELPKKKLIIYLSDEFITHQLN